MSTHQLDVYECIRDELLFQETVKMQICQDSQMEYQDDSPRSVAGWLLLVKGKYDDIVYSLSHEAGTLYTLGQLRELAALCIQCIMEHGGFGRQPNGTLIRLNYVKPLGMDLAWDVAVLERKYQDSFGPERTDGHAHSISEYLVMFDTYRRTAFDAWTHNVGDEAAIQIIGKLLGIVVHCLEDHGAPKREWDHVRRP